MANLYLINSKFKYYSIPIRYYYIIAIIIILTKAINKIKDYKEEEERKKNSLI